jgi:hypothetical protein
VVQFRKNQDTELLEVFHEETQSYSAVVTLLQLVGGLKSALIPEQAAKLESLIEVLTDIKSVNTSKLEAILTHSVFTSSNYLIWNNLGLAQLVDQSRISLNGINSRILNIQDAITDLINSQLLPNGDTSAELLGNILQELFQLSTGLANVKIVIDNLLIEVKGVARQTTLTEAKEFIQEVRDRLPPHHAPVKVNPFAEIKTTAGTIPDNHKYCSILVRSGTVTISGVNISNLVIPEGESFVNEQISGECYGSITYVPAGVVVIYYKV